MLAAALLLAQADTSPYSRATVVSSVKAAAPGVPFTVAVRIGLDPKWHTYWSNPGDSGSATRIDWTLPKGWKVSPARFQVPHRILTGDIVSFGYERAASVLFTVTPPANAKTATLKAAAQWLVCQESCVPAQASLSLKVPIEKPWVQGANLEGDLAKLPKTDKDWQVTARTTGKGYVLEAKNAPASLNPESAFFFPSDPAVLNHAAPQTFQQTSAGFRADFEKSPYATGDAKRLRGVLVLYEGGPALNVDVPVLNKE